MKLNLLISGSNFESNETPLILKGYFLERRGRRDAIIILILMIIIAAVITSWLTGLWSCESGRKDLTEKERLTIADYINSISVLVQHSNKISLNFFTTLNKIKDISKEELDANLAQSIEESSIILENGREINPPEFFEVSQGYLELVFDTRNRAYENFKPSLFNVLQDIDFDDSSNQIANSFLFMYMSDELYKYFQDELKVAGEKLGISNLTIIDSSVLQDKNLLNTTNVSNLIADFKSVTNLQVRRGVAVISQSINFDPKLLNEQDEYLIIKKGSKISISINIQNQGNVTEKDVPVKLTYKVEDVSKSEEKTQSIDTINPSEQKTVTFSDITAYPGKKCEIKIEAGPVPDEVLFTNNTEVYKFMMEK